MTAKNYNRVFAQTLEHAKDAELDVADDAVTAHLAHYTEDTVKGPDDDEFHFAFEDDPQHRRPLRATRVRMLLEAIEAELRGPDVEQLAPPNNTVAGTDASTGAGRTTGGKPLAVDHMLPQKWRDTVPVPTDNPTAAASAT